MECVEDEEDEEGILDKWMVGNVIKHEEGEIDLEDNKDTTDEVRDKRSDGKAATVDKVLPENGQRLSVGDAQNQENQSSHGEPMSMVEAMTS
ncbi:unnamed protein product [Lactuca virosa]|uniref:Uncharacterized protein n=1 Tax=Lactuca virosa TaxID=75947 RepID=A0AAU9MJX0_9ASTR|nr:unnamed protein product [Lactuca virosa]